MTDQTNIKTQTAHDTHLLFRDIADVIRQARHQVRQAVNTAMVQSYWQVGHLIVEHEQQGQQRAAYGKQQLQQLSKQLTTEFGKGFDVRNLRNMRSFYTAYPNRNAVRTELSWTHYRTLLRVDYPSKPEHGINKKRLNKAGVSALWSGKSASSITNVFYPAMIPLCLRLKPKRRSTPWKQR